MLSYKNYIYFLILEVITVPIVILIFKNIEPRNIAAVLAGTIFVALGAYILKKSWSYKKSLLIYAAGMHLFSFALPMLIMRIFHWSSDFESIQIFGLSGPQFHKVSEIFFTVLIACTLIDLVRSYLAAPEN